jgi:Flp pilus assembly protein TadG
MNRVWFRTGPSRTQTFRASEHGQSAVEFAVVLPVLIVLLLGVADFGRVFLVSVAVNNAARAGAQYGSQTVATAQDSSGIQTAASTDFGCVAAGGNSCPNLSNWSTPTVKTCTCGPLFGTVTACPTTGSNFYCKDSSGETTYVTVNTSATFNTILPYPGVPSSMTLTGQAIMQVQQN